MTEPNFGIPPGRNPARRADVLNALMGFLSVACIVGGAVCGVVFGQWPTAVFLALVAIWVEIGG